MLKTCLECPYLNSNLQHPYLKPYTSPSLSTSNIVNRDKVMEGCQKMFTHFSLLSPPQPSISTSLILFTVHWGMQLAAGLWQQWVCWCQCSQSSWEKCFQRTRTLLFMQPLPVGPQSFLYTSQGCLQTGPLVFLGVMDMAAGGWGGQMWGLLLTGLMLSVTCSARGLLCPLHIWLHCSVKLHCVKILQVLSRYSSKAFKTRLIWCKLMQLHQVNGVMLYYS